MNSAFDQPIQQPSSCFGFCSDESELVQKGFIYHSASGIPQNDDSFLTLEDEQKKQEVDDLLSQAMSGLAFEERQEQQELLHGVDEDVEDGAFMNRALQDLDYHLSCSKHGSVYEMAEREDPEYVSARPFRVMFLRGNRCNAKSAADQILRFFESKHQLFGKDKLVQDITIADLDEDDVTCLKAGALQLAGRDRSGRQVFVFYARIFGELISSMTLQNFSRAQFLIAMTALKSEETQRRGTVSVWYAVGDWKDDSSNGMGYFERMAAAKVFPQKKQGIHICVDEMRQYALSNVIAKIAPKKLRARLRLHFGTQMECQYQLLTYGILSESLALDANGRMKFERHLDWVHSCSSQSYKHDVLVASKPISSVSSELTIATPTPHDVLFNGGKVTYHPGNRYFLALISEYSKVYDECRRNRAKLEILCEIMEKIQASGGRFLKPTARGTLWIEVPLEERRKKITQAFRNRRRYRKK